jgi:hypothetical protein
MMLELPAPESEKEDILFEENQVPDKPAVEAGIVDAELKILPEYIVDAFTVNCPAQATRKIKTIPIVNCDKCESKRNCAAWGI